MSTVRIRALVLAVVVAVAAMAAAIASLLSALLGATGVMISVWAGTAFVSTVVTTLTGINFVYREPRS